MNNPEDPRAHAAALPGVAGAAPPDRHERLLHGVLSRGTVAGDPVGERKRCTPMPVVDRLERLWIAAGHELHQLLVRQQMNVLYTQVVNTLPPARSRQGPFRITRTPRPFSKSCALPHNSGQS